MQEDSERNSEHGEQNDVCETCCILGSGLSLMDGLSIMLGSPFRYQENGWPGPVILKVLHLFRPTTVSHQEKKFAPLHTAITFHHDKVFESTA